MINHIAIYTIDLEKMKDFYVKYFDGNTSPLYHNERKGFKSYFVSFSGGASLELMQSITVNDTKNTTDKQYVGYAHISFSVGSKENVDSLTERLVTGGYVLESGPRTTGDGFYESVVFDPELNRVEITV
jgi:lactoylglutathione lyase